MIAELEGATLRFEGKEIRFPGVAREALEALAAADGPIRARDLPGGLDEASRLVHRAPAGARGLPAGHAAALRSIRSTTATNASTTRGSNWGPAQRRSSASASTCESARR